MLIQTEAFSFLLCNKKGKMNFKKLKIFFSTVQRDFILAVLARNTIFHPSLWGISEQVDRYLSRDFVPVNLFSHFPPSTSNILKDTSHMRWCLVNSGHGHCYPFRLSRKSIWQFAV